MSFWEMMFCLVGSPLKKTAVKTSNGFDNNQAFPEEVGSIESVYTLHHSDTRQFKVLYRGIQH